jgi:peptidoglycan/LPS O-acetylase OafA/YrhL
MRNLGLDLLRLVAVVLVLGRHIRLPADPPAILAHWNTGGWVGVDLFFVLSGFLVSGLLFREHMRDGSIDAKRFLIRRGLKIYPAFYAMIAFTVAVKLCVGEPLPPGRVAGEAFFLQNYVGGLWDHTWSLAVEEHFYFGIALLFLVIARTARERGPDPFRAIPQIFLATALACLSLRVINLFLWPEYSHERFLFGTHIRIDSLMFGVLLSYLWHYRGLAGRMQWCPTVLLVVPGIALLAPAFFFTLETHRLVSVLGLVAFYCGSGLLVLASTRLTASTNRLLRLGGALGAASYSMYLWHLPIAVWGWRFVTKLTPLDGFVAHLAFYLGGAMLFGWLMSRVIEWPVLQVRDRLFPARDRGDRDAPTGETCLPRA